MSGRFVHHDPLPAANHFSDEGAANHTRLCEEYDKRGLEIFVYGRRALDANDSAPKKFPARQTYEACATIARNHQLDPSRVVFLKQNSTAIDAGAFHNDVVAVGNRSLLLHHDDAYADHQWTERINAIEDVTYIGGQFSLDDAVKTYLFNSQLVTVSDGSMAIIAPVESRESEAVAGFIEQFVDGNPISAVHYVDVRQSMQNGGGPACLRLRVVLNDDEVAATNPGVIWGEVLHQKLIAWVEKHYRDELKNEDLVDPKLLVESRDALDERTRILGIGNVYESQGVSYN